MNLLALALESIQLKLEEVGLASQSDSRNKLLLQNNFNSGNKILNIQDFS